MNHLLHIIIYLIVGIAEWWLALRRTLACVKQEKGLLMTIVFVENLVGLMVLQNFISSGDWLIAVSYSIGGSLGAFLSFKKDK
jgi:hypothetical protein